MNEIDEKIDSSLGLKPNKRKLLKLKKKNKIKIISGVNQPGILSKLSRGLSLGKAKLSALVSEASMVERKQNLIEIEPVEVSGHFAKKVPIVSNIKPTSGPLTGTRDVVINGTGFGTVADTVVVFNGNTITPKAVTPTRITFDVPSYTRVGLVQVSVITSRGRSGNVPSGFSYFTAPIGRKSSSILSDDTPDMARRRRLLEQDGHRYLAKVHAREHRSEEDKPAPEGELQNSIKQHPWLDAQRFDGVDPNLNPEPPLNTAARREFDNERREQEMEKQLRLGNMPKFSTAPKPEFK
ncbi:putative Smr domain protein [Legionella busanensis]|uniref:Putative Smr domain protein n=1 Tax=Legionella busanensis TaxID=190655 RepID=A0A378JPT0_9GAMM|nr:IPT/TIG domain-containing protein [Legionella busanensis]STX52273.1 putative Smr domain protein [Legionella busanensis]